MTEEEVLELVREHNLYSQYQFFKIFLGMPPIEILKRLGIYETGETI